MRGKQIFPVGIALAAVVFAAAFSIDVGSLMLNQAGVFYSGFHGGGGGHCFPPPGRNFAGGGMIGMGVREPGRNFAGGGAIGGGCGPGGGFHGEYGYFPDAGRSCGGGPRGGGFDGRGRDYKYVDGPGRDYKYVGGRGRDYKYVDSGDRSHEGSHGNVYHRAPENPYRGADNIRQRANYFENRDASRQNSSGIGDENGFGRRQIARK